MDRCALSVRESHRLLAMRAASCPSLEPTSSDRELLHLLIFRGTKRVRGLESHGATLAYIAEKAVRSSP